MNNFGREISGSDTSVCDANCCGQAICGSTAAPIQLAMETDQEKKEEGKLSPEKEKEDEFKEANPLDPIDPFTGLPKLYSIPPATKNYFENPPGNGGKPPAKDKGIIANKTTPVGEPVNIVTGEYIEAWTDYIIAADMTFDGHRSMKLKLLQPGGYTGPFGPGQIGSFDEVISTADDGNLTFFQADGKVVRFERPFNFLPSINAGSPHLELTACWLKQLELRDQKIIKHFCQYDDGIYRLMRIEDSNCNAITLLRNDVGMLQSACGTNGLVLVFENNGDGRRISSSLRRSNSCLKLSRYKYDHRGRMTEADCSFGMSVRYAWHPDRDLLLSWHNLTKRSETHFTYDENGRVLHTRTNGIWNDDRFRFDPANRETTYLPSGDTRLAQRFRYDENDNVTHEIDALDGILQHTFDAAGFETATTDANGHVTTMAYDTRGNVKRHVDAEGRATTYGWGPHGELDVVIDGAGHIRKYENDEKGNCLAETDAEGHTTRYVRDERGRLLRTILPDGAEESRAYDAHGWLISITDARGGVTRFAHDAFGRVVETTDALGHVTHTEYEAGAGGFATPSAIVRPDGVRVSRAYTENGVLASVTDGEGRTWAYTYGAFDVLQAIEDPKGGRLAFAHDGEGRVIGITNQMGVTYRLIRDAAGRVIAEENFDGRRTEYTRDPGGRVVETRKPDGIRLAYTYDKTDKLTSIKGYAADDPYKSRLFDETHFWYDSRGLLIRASNLAAIVEFERDGNGRITCETVNGRRVESKFDARGNRVERRIGSGEPGEGLVRYAHDPLGMVSEIAIDDHAPLTFTRDALGRETRRASAKGFCLEQKWDAVGQLMHQLAGTRQAERRYVWDKAGAPTRIDDAIWGETTYRYDANGQVSESRFSDGFTEKFEYDAAKNVAGVSLKGPQLGAGLGKLLAWRSSAGGVVQLSHGPNGERVALTHDACGRVVIRRVDRKGFRPQTWAYGWDILDRLVRCDNPDGETWFYRYDAFGRRLSKVRKLSDRELAWTAQKYSLLVPVVARESTKLWSWPEPPNNVSASSDQRPPVVGVHFLWDGGVLSEEAPLRLDGTTDWASATRWHYEVNSFRPMAKESAEGILLPIVNDHIGTPQEVFCDSGSAQWAASYNTWGSVRGVQRQSKPEHDDGQRAIYTRAKTNEDRAGRVFAEDAALDCPLRFQGQWQDKENGLTYNFHRYYDAVSASYISSDPIGLRGGLRTQSYVMNPLCGIDPWGLRSSVPLREGEVGRFGDLDDRAVAGDNLTPHHIPSDKHNEPAGVSRRDGIAVMMRHEDHKNTFTYGGRNRGQGGDRALGTGAAISKGAGELPGMMPNMSPSQMDTIQSEIVRQNLEGPHPGVDIP